MKNKLYEVRAINTLAARKSSNIIFPALFLKFCLVTNWQLTQMKRSDWSSGPAKSKQIEFISEQKICQIEQ